MCIDGLGDYTGKYANDENGGIKHDNSPANSLNRKNTTRHVGSSPCLSCLYENKQCFEYAINETMLDIELTYMDYTHILSTENLMNTCL